MFKGAIIWGDFLFNFKLICFGKLVGVDCWGGYTVLFYNYFLINKILGGYMVLF